MDLLPSPRVSSLSSKHGGNGWLTLKDFPSMGFSLVYLISEALLPLLSSRLQQQQRYISRCSGDARALPFNPMICYDLFLLRLRRVLPFDTLLDNRKSRALTF
ncbi:hypothetical protein FSOLCH5_014981 [Fusarium solani]|jgi:hypothetical protein